MSRLRAWLPWSLVALLAATTGWLGFRSWTQPPAHPAPIAGPEPTPRGLVAWPDGKAAAELLGYEAVHAFRWTGGFVTGWVEFADGPKPRRVPIEVHDLLPAPQRANPVGVSGRVIVARRTPLPQPPKDGPELEVPEKPRTECWVWVELEWDGGVWGQTGHIRRSMTYRGNWQSRNRDSPADEADGTMGGGEYLSFHSGSFKRPESKWLELHFQTGREAE